MKRLLFLLMLVLFIVGCKETGEKETTQALSEFQITACSTAHEAGTCDTRLSEVGIVSKEDCCKALEKCC